LLLVQRGLYQLREPICCNQWCRLRRRRRRFVNFAFRQAARILVAQTNSFPYQHPPIEEVIFTPRRLQRFFAILVRLAKRYVVIRKKVFAAAPMNKNYEQKTEKLQKTL